MMQASIASTLIPFAPFLFLSGMISLVAYLLAPEKGRNVLLWAVLGAVPFVNVISLVFFIGSANLRQERKIDRLLALSGGGKTSTPNSWV